MNRPLTALLCCALAGALASCDGQPEGERALGYVEAQWVYIAAPASGWLTADPPGEGSSVAIGEPLFTLDSDRAEHAVEEARARLQQAQAEARNLSSGAREPEVQALEAQLAQAEARLEFARRENERIQPLAAKGLEQQARADQARADLDAAEAAVTAARENIAVARLAGRPDARAAADAAVSAFEANLRSALYALDERSIEARVTGRVSERFFRSGEFVRQGDRVLAILPDDGLKVRFTVPQRDLPALRVGGAITVTADGLAAPLAASISYIASEAEFAPPMLYTRDMRDKLVFLVEARLPVAGGLHPGLPVEVSW